MLKASISIFDVEGRLRDWNERFAQEFEGAASILSPGVSYLEILDRCEVPARALDMTMTDEFKERSSIQYIQNGHSVIVKVERSIVGNLIRSAFFDKGEMGPEEKDSGISPDHLKSMRTGALRMAAAILSQRNKSDASMRDQAETDELTHLPNRRKFMTGMGRIWADIKHNGSAATAAVLMADLDHFKRINDTHGHLAGDEVLKGFARVLREVGAREGDLVGRLGGEEFVLLLPDATAEVGQEIGRKLCEKTRNLTFNLAGEAVHISVSIGVSVLSVNDETPEAALSRADAALYRAKGNGRDRVEVQA